MGTEKLAITVIAETLNRGITLIVSLVLAKTLTVSDFGQFTIFVSTISIGQTIIDFGSQNFGVKSLIKNKGFIRYKIILTSLKYRLIGLIIWIIFSSCYLILYHTQVNPYYFILWGILYFLSFDWIFKGIGKIAQQAGIFAIVNLFFAILILGLVYLNQEIYLNKAILISKILPLLVSTTIFSFIMLSNEITKKVALIKIFIFKYKFNPVYFKENLHFTLGGFSARLYNSIGMILLGSFLVPSVVGEVSYSYILFTIFSLGRGILVSSVFPTICEMKAIEAKSYVLKRNLILTTLTGISFILFYFYQNEIISIFLPDSLTISSIIRSNFYLCALLIFLNCFSFFNLAYIQSFFGGRYFNFIMIIASVVLIVTIISLLTSSYAPYSLFTSLIFTEISIFLITSYIIWIKK